MTITEAKSLTHGQIVYELGQFNADGTPARWRVSGAVKTWKRSPDRVRVPIKHGMYDNAHITEDNLDFIVLTEAKAVNVAEAKRRAEVNRVMPAKGGAS